MIWPIWPNFVDVQRSWFHIDGAFGRRSARSRRAREAAHSFGIERAHSVAFDSHKWAHVPYDAWISALFATPKLTG